MAVDKGYKAAVFQLEMNQISILERIMANRASIPMDKLKKGELSDEEWCKVAGDVSEGGGVILNAGKMLRAQASQHY